MRVLKYELLPGVTRYEMAAEARPVFVHEQRDRIFVWVETPDLSSDYRVRAFEMFATGQPFDGGTYIGSATMEDASLIWHVYEVPDLP